jgi:hypothetical protein
LSIIEPFFCTLSEKTSGNYLKTDFLAKIKIPIEKSEIM